MYIFQLKTNNPSFETTFSSTLIVMYATIKKQFLKFNSKGVEKWNAFWRQARCRMPRASTGRHKMQLIYNSDISFDFPRSVTDVWRLPCTYKYVWFHFIFILLPTWFSLRYHQAVERLFTKPIFDQRIRFTIQCGLTFEHFSRWQRRAKNVSASLSAGKAQSGESMVRWGTLIQGAYM